MRTLVTFVIWILRSALALFRSREEQVIVELALRQQLAVYAQNHQRPRLSSLDRTFWVVLSRFWPVRSQYSSALIILSFSALPAFSILG